jgi:starch synthase
MKTAPGSRARTGRNAGGDEPGLSILMVASEAVPFAKTGGLADVVGALSCALGRLGHAVTLVLPRYRGVKPDGALIGFPVAVPGYAAPGYFQQPLGRNVRAVLVECPELYDREHVYGPASGDYPDNARRFGLLSRFAAEFAARADVPFSVVHAHDWHAGLVPVYLRTEFAAHPRVGGIPTVFTIHNLAYQGLFPAAAMDELGLPANLFSVDGLEFWGGVSFLKAGIAFSTLMTTVSPTYAAEIQTPEYGCGFDGVLALHASRLSGILNGIDVDEWNPSRDRFLREPYDARRLEQKQAAKTDLLKDFGLPVPPDGSRRPLVGLVTRLVGQKGMDLMRDAADQWIALDASFVLLGTGEERFQEFWRATARRHPDRVAVHIGFDERRAHLIEAGADIFLMPSRFEPCGLNQMYSMRYGTVPVVRRTGGLADTVTDFSPESGEGTGFTFGPYTPEALAGALKRALDTYAQPGTWQAIQRAGMRQDFSWERSARDYVTLYRAAVESR